MKFDIVGMHCAVCAGKVESTVRKINGVKEANVNLIEKTLSVEAENVKAKDIIKAIENAGFKASLHKSFKADENEYKKMKMNVIYSFIFAIVLFYVAMGEMFHLPMPQILLENTLLYGMVELLVLVPILIINFNYFTNGFKALFKGSANMNTLIAIGATSAILYSLYSLFNMIINPLNANFFRHSLYFESAGTILTVISFGKLLEYGAKENTKNALKKLIDLSSGFATVLKDGKEINIKKEQINPNDIVIVKKGQIVPVDGVIVEGNCSVDESMLNGESIPIFKEISNNVISGSILKSGFIKVRAQKTGKNTTLSKIIQLVENINSTKAPIGRFVDKVSSYFVPTVMILSFITFVVWMIISKNVETSLCFAISILVISCPCALGLASPASIMVASGKASQNGILFKNSKILEKAHSIDTIVLDKTGTITQGKIKVDKITPLKDISSDEILKIAASIEKMSNHPFAKAIVDKANEDKLELKDVQNYEQFEGKGLKGNIDGHLYLIGNERFFIENNINIIENQDNGSILFSKDNVLQGIITLSDTIKPSSKIAIDKFKKMDLEIIMLTGDNQKTAQKIADEIGINNVIAEVLPEDKENTIKNLQNENKTVMMVGDGINDAPSLMRADVGVAIGSGYDITVESADIVLVKNNLVDIVNAIKISKATILNIKQNLFWALFYNSIAIPVAGGCFYSIGLKLNPGLCALIMGLSSVFVVSNALRLNNIKLDNL